MTILEKPIEQPWAFATRKGFTGDAAGNYFTYAATKEEIERRLAKFEKRWPSRWHGPIENRPSESWYAGTI